jgi:hypothetical protein
MECRGRAGSLLLWISPKFFLGKSDIVRDTNKKESTQSHFDPFSEVGIAVHSTWLCFLWQINLAIDPFCE